MDVAWLKARVAKGKNGVTEKLDDMGTVVNRTAETVQRLATELRPRLLDELGLPAAIRWQTREFQSRTGVVCDLEMAEELPDALDPVRAVAVFRILQETLTNVTRHSGATRVLVRFHLTRRHAPRRGGQRPGDRPTDHARLAFLGLLGIEERATMLGGTVSIRGTPGQGTTVSLTLPRA